MFFFFSTETVFKGRNFDVVVAKVLDPGIVVKEFQLQLPYYVHFQTNDPWETLKATYPLNYELDCSATLLR